MFGCYCRWHRGDLAGSELRPCGDPWPAADQPVHHRRFPGAVIARGLDQQIPVPAVPGRMVHQAVQAGAEHGGHDHAGHRRDRAGKTAQAGRCPGPRSSAWRTRISAETGSPARAAAAAIADGRRAGSRPAGRTARHATPASTASGIRARTAPPPASTSGSASAPREGSNRCTGPAGYSGKAAYAPPAARAAGGAASGLLSQGRRRGWG